MNVMLRGVTAFITPATIYMVLFLLYDKLYFRKYKNVCIYTIAYICTVCIMFFVNYLGNPFFNVVSAFLIANIVGFCLFKAQIKRALIYNNFIILIFFILDTVSVTIWMVIGNKGFKEVLSDYQAKSICCLIYILLVFFMYRVFVITLYSSEMSEIKVREIGFMILLTAFEVFFVGCYVLKSTNRQDGFRIIIILLCFLVINAVMTSLLKRVSEAYKYKYELDAVRYQNEIQLLHYHELTRKYEDSRRIIHDIKKHLEILNALQGSDKERAKYYSELIGKQVEGVFGNFFCSNRILSVVMGQKISLAESEHIHVETRVEDVLFDFMNDMDITAIFANLWDNAIEACRKVEEKDRFIHIYLEKESGIIVLDMENSFDGIIREDENNILSTKSHHEGVGLGIIKATVEKYEGIVHTDYEGNTFHVEITIPQ